MGLTLSLLSGLSRLLELLSSWFNVTLGEKLLEHLRKWTDPDALASGPRAWKPSEEMKVAGGICELFHFLPLAASKFVVPLVDVVQEIETRSNIDFVSSPLRMPTIRFLARHPV